MYIYNKLLYLFFIFFSVVSMSYAENIDSPTVAAKVNGQVISVSELDNAVSQALQMLKRHEQMGYLSEVSTETAVATKRNILDEMIESIILKEQSQKMKIVVPQDEIQHKLDEIRAGFPSEDFFIKALEEEGIAYNSLEQGIYEQVLSEKISEELTKDISIPSADIVAFYDSNRAMFMGTEKIRVKHIVVGTSIEARSIRERLLAGESFDELEKKYSFNYDANIGHRYEIMEKGFAENPQLELLFDLAEGEISHVVRMDNGYSIYKVIDKESAGGLEKKSVRDKIKKYLLIEKKQRIYHEWLREVKNRADVYINETILPDNIPLDEDDKQNIDDQKKEPSDEFFDIRPNDNLFGNKEIIVVS